MIKLLVLRIRFVAVTFKLLGTGLWLRPGMYGVVCRILNSNPHWDNDQVVAYLLVLYCAMEAKSTEK